MADLEAAGLSRSQMAMVRTFSAANRSIKPSQAARILKTFTFDDDRLQAAALLIPHLSNRQNAFRLFSALDSGHSYEALAAELYEENRREQGPP